MIQAEIAVKFARASLHFGIAVSSLTHGFLPHTVSSGAQRSLIHALLYVLSLCLFVAPPCLFDSGLTCFVSDFLLPSDPFLLCLVFQSPIHRHEQAYPMDYYLQQHLP